jgi:large subunit ribosomal protein L25
LKIGSKLLITEIDNKNCTFLHPDNTVVAQVRMSRNATSEDEEEEVAEEAAESAAE